MIEQTTPSEPSPRNTMFIALEIIEMIPKDKIDFYNDIYHLIHSDYVYKDQNALQTPHNWIKLQNIMHRHIPAPDEEWKEKIVYVFIGKTKS